MKKYVIIGASAAGLNAARTIRKLDKSGEICILSKDEKIISRCMLHHVISGNKKVEDISFVTDDFFTKNNIQWIKGIKVVDILFDQKKIILNNGEKITFDSLLIASGARSTIPPIKGIKAAQNVYGLRDMQDVENIVNNAKKSKSALVIGAGLIGLDAASSLLEQGLKVTIIEMADRLLPLQLDSYTANKYQELFEKTGAEIYTSTTVNEIITDNQGTVNRVKLSNNNTITCDMIIIATGITPNLDFVKNNALEITKGIKVNQKMQSTIPDVYAAGDVTGLSAIWPAAVKQGIIAGTNMAGGQREVDDFFNEKNTINLLGLTTISLGMIQPPDSTYKVDKYNVNGTYKKIIHKDNKVYGIIIQNNISRCGIWTSLIKDKVKVKMNDSPIYTQSYADYYAIDKNGKFNILGV